MIANHRQFIAAMTAKKMVRVRFRPGGTDVIVERICAPLDYGPETEAPGAFELYWVWNYANDGGVNPLGLLPEQIVDIEVLDRDFRPAAFGSVFRQWRVPRNWDVRPELHCALMAC